MTDKKHEALFVLPSLHNLQASVFLVLPNQRLVCGTLLVGGNCLVFNPAPRASAQKYVYKKYQTQGLVKVLLDNIEKIALA